MHHIREVLRLHYSVGMSQRAVARSLGLVRTVQRRLKIWRSAMAHELVFGRGLGAAEAAPADAQRPEPTSAAGLQT